MECIYCGFSLPSNANFCPKCFKQVICLSCKELLFKDSQICISCGEPIKNRPKVSDNSINNIHYSETENSREFTASFTDTVAGNVVETLAQLLPLKPNKAIDLQSKDKDDVFIEDALVIDQNSNETLKVENEYAERQEEKVDVKTKVEESPNKDLEILEKIFKEKDGSVRIYDTRIKAKNKGDFVARITLLFLYLNKIKGAEEIKREKLNDFLKSEDLYDGNFRNWLSNNVKFISIDSDLISLRPEGQEKAIEIMSEFNNDKIENGWEYQRSGKKSSAPKEEKDNTNESNVKNKSKSKSKKILNYQLDNSLDLFPKDKQSLTDFFNVYKASINFEYNLIFVYYLEKILLLESINISHIYTCYKGIGLEVPNIYQSLVDTKKSRGWIDTSDMNHLKVSVAGENYIEHKMKRA